MANSVNYLVKDDLNKELDRLLLSIMELSSLYDGKPCRRCNVVQGTESMGVKKYYCEHFTAKIDRKLRKAKESIARKIYLFITAPTPKD